jgi:hypothetical protein
MNHQLTNKCNNCETMNPLGSTSCINCNQELQAIHDNNELIKQFQDITGGTREIALQLLEISNSVNDAISLYFESNNNYEMEIDEGNITNEISDEFTNELTERFNMSEDAINEIVNIVYNGSTRDRNALLSMLSTNEYQYPNTPNEFQIQILYGWGKNEPHYCGPCSAKAFFNFIKIKNTDIYNILNLVPERVFVNAKIENSIEKRIEYIKTNLENIDNMLMTICDYLSNSFDNIYKIYDRLLKKGNVTNEDFLIGLEYRSSMNYRIIWETLHQTNLSNVIPKDDRINKLIELTKSQTFIQFITNEWKTKVHHHPVLKETINCLRHEKIDSDKKLQELKLYNEKCPICIEDFKTEKLDITILNCHAFHTNCVLKWFETNDTCPVCRKKIESDSKKPACELHTENK